MSRARVRAAVALLFVFALGALAGVAFERHHRPPHGIAVIQQHEAAMSELRDVVGLDDRQVAEIHAIMARHQDVVQHMWEQLRPEVQAAMRQVHEEIAALLDSEQRERFHRWLIEHGAYEQTPQH